MDKKVVLAFYVHAGAVEDLGNDTLVAMYRRLADHIRRSVEELHKRYPDKPVVRVDISFEPMERHGV